MKTDVTPCTNCPLRKREIFSDFTAEEEVFMERFKAGEMQIEAGAPIVTEGTRAPHLFTVLAGVGLRYATLEDGRRQVLNFVFPGDLIGLQSAVMEEMGHSVEAKTDMTLCVFPRARFWEMFKSSPARSYDVTWMAAREERLLSDNLVSVGRLTGLERIAFAVYALFKRYREVGMAEGDSFPRDFTQSEIADAIGLSVVHTNKLLRKLRLEGLAEWGDTEIRVKAPEALAALAKIDPTVSRTRPLI